MKYFPHGMSLLTFVILLGYIQYKEKTTVVQEARAAEPATAFVTPDEPATKEYRHFLNAVSLELPQHMEFAGESVPLNINDVSERLDRELLINTYWHSSTIFLIKRAHEWLPKIEKILAENGVPDDFKYLTAVEGGFMNQISGAGAVGFWQILESSGKENGLEINKFVDERYDPLKSTEAACKYLKKAYAKFGNWTSAAASYNRGMSGLNRAMEDQKVDSYYDLLLNDETSRYVFRILAIKEIVENPAKYGFDIDKHHLYQPQDVEYIEVDDDIKDLVQWSLDQGINYKILKLYNPWLRQEKLKVSRNKVYEIAIPASQVR